MLVKTRLKQLAAAIIRLRLVSRSKRQVGGSAFMTTQMMHRLTEDMQTIQIHQPTISQSVVWSTGNYTHSQMMEKCY